MGVIIRAHPVPVNHTFNATPVESLQQPCNANKNRVGNRNHQLLASPETMTTLVHAGGTELLQISW